ncbi:MAG: hypothetical protein PHS86_13985, partial [Syntrophaceae bacterium]|nr:hypothetical protein [Syntrophaceae bacterium]
ALVEKKLDYANGIDRATGPLSVVFSGGKLILTLQSGKFKIVSLMIAPANGRNTFRYACP